MDAEEYNKQAVVYKVQTFGTTQWEINMETFRYLESRLGLEGGNDPEDMPDAGDNSRGIGERGSF